MKPLPGDLTGRSAPPFPAIVFPGLWLDPAALTGGDLSRVLAVLQAGVASAEHGEFVERLARKGVSGE